MEEDELLENGKPITPPKNNVDSLFEDLKKIESGQDLNMSTTSGAYGSVDYNTGIGSSKYDKGMISSIDLDPNNAAKALQEYRARMQPTSHQIANAAAKLPFNVALGTVGTIASALDIEDYKNSDDEVGNWLTTLTNEGQDWINSKAAIHRRNPGQALDLSDGGWWVSSLSSLAESIGSFALGGGVLGKGLTGAATLFKGMAGLSKSAKVQKLANAIYKTNAGVKIGKATEVGANAAMLNQAEGILEATEVQKEIYEKYVGELGEEAARQKAAEAAATVISVNRLNTLLNITSAGRFFKSNRFTRAAYKPETGLKSLKEGAFEGAQESAEELINMVAGGFGRAKGHGTKYGADEILEDIVSAEGLEAAILGFVGGMGQTIVTEQGVNRFMKTGDPDNPGEKISIREFNKKQYEKFQEHIDEINTIDLAESFRATAGSIKINQEIGDYEAKIRNLNQQGKHDEAKALEPEVEKLKNSLVDVQAYDAFNKGTTEHLIKYYQEAANGERKDGFPEDYKELALKQVEKIKNLEKIFNKSMLYENSFEVYLNRSSRKELADSVKDYKAKLGEAEVNLREEVDRLTEGTGFDTADRGLLFFENNKIKTPEFTKVSQEIKDLEAYEDFVEARANLVAVEGAIRRQDKKYKDLIKPETQENAKKKKKKRNENVKKKIEEQSKELERKAKENREKEAKEKKVKEQKEKEQKANEASNKTKEEVESEYDKIAKQYAIGEQVPIPSNLGEEYKDQDATLKEIDEDKGVIILSMVDGREIEISKEDNTSRITTAILEGEYSSEGGTNFTPQQQVNDNQDESEVGGAKIISTYDDGTPIKFMADQWGEYLTWEREPRNKKGETVGFRINPNRDKFSAKTDWIVALDILNNYQEGRITEISNKQRRHLYAYLPILGVFGSDQNTFAPIETLPDRNNLDPEQGNRALENFTNHSLPLRKQIIDAMIDDGVNISDIKGKIQDQFKGVLQIAPKENGQVVENNILDLHAINGDIDRVQLYMVNHRNNLVTTSGKVKQGNISGKGEVYMPIPRANGDPFFLKLNVRKIQTNEAEALYRMYTLRMREQDVAKATSLKELDKADLDFLNEQIPDVLKVLSTQKRKKDLTLKDITDFLIWDGSSNPKSQVRLEGAKLHYGNKSIFGEEVNLKNNKDAFIEFLTQEKRHHIKFKPKPNDMMEFGVDNEAYKEYILRSGILNTNAVVGKESPTFQGRTHIYLEKDVTTPVKKEEPKKPSPVIRAAKDGKSPEDIDAEINAETDAKLMEFAEKYMAEGMDDVEAFEKAAEDIEELVKKLEEEKYGVSTETAPTSQAPIVETTKLLTPEEDIEAKRQAEINNRVTALENVIKSSNVKIGVNYIEGVNKENTKKLLEQAGYNTEISRGRLMYYKNNSSIFKETEGYISSEKLEGLSYPKEILLARLEALREAITAKYDKELENLSETSRKSQEDSVSLPTKKRLDTETKEVNKKGSLKSSRSKRRSKRKPGKDDTNENNKFCG